MLDLNSRELRKAAAKLVRDYPDDLEQSAPEEFVQYAEQSQSIYSIYYYFNQLHCTLMRSLLASASLTRQIARCKR